MKHRVSSVRANEGTSKNRARTQPTNQHAPVVFCPKGVKQPESRVSSFGLEVVCVAGFFLYLLKDFLLGYALLSKFYEPVAESASFSFLHLGSICVTGNSK